jgi:hypothetical protein
MELTCHPRGSLTVEECAEGVRFLRRRFAEEWGLTRLDIHIASLAERENLTIREKHTLIGWLGIESSHELANACVEKGYPGNAVMGHLLQAAFQRHPSVPFFVYVPTERLASAAICVRSGLILPANHPPHFKTLIYPERAITLVRLDRCHWPGAERLSRLQVRQELSRLREATRETAGGGNILQPLSENF